MSAGARIDSDRGDLDFNQSKAVTACSYAQHVLPRSSGAYLRALLAGSETIMTLDQERFRLLLP